MRRTGTAAATAVLGLVSLAVYFGLELASDGGGTARGDSSSGWLELIDGHGLELWTKAPMHRNKQFRDRWLHVGDAYVKSPDDTVLSTRPGTGVLVNGRTGRTWNIVTKQQFGDMEAHIEFLIPKGSNSGVYFMGRYEIQVFDSWGQKHVKYSDCGGIYQRWDPSRGKGREGFEGHAPRINASKPPGQWQTFDVVFRAPRFDARGRKIANACFVRVVHNGVVVHENVEVTGPTRAATFDDEQPTGPLMLQGDHGPVAYRNIRVRPLTRK